MRALFVALSSVLLCCLAALPSRADESYPSRPIRLVVPFAAGGNTDVVGRIFSAKMSDVLGQRVYVENLGGAGGVVGSRTVMGATPDGYTLLLGTVTTHAIQPLILREPPYDPVGGFEPITMVVDAPMVLVVHQSVPATTLKEFMDLLRTSSPELNYGTAGFGTAGHLAGLWLAEIAKGRVNHVPYRGDGPATQDLLTGIVKFKLDTVAVVQPHLQAGTLRALAVSTNERAPSLPEVPTSGEAGVPQFIIYSWNVLLAPRNTPRPILDKLAAAWKSAAADPAIVARLREIGNYAVATTPADARARLESERAKWKPLVEIAGAAQK